MFLRKDVEEADLYKNWSNFGWGRVRCAAYIREYYFSVKFFGTLYAIVYHISRDPKNGSTVFRGFRKVKWCF